MFFMKRVSIFVLFLISWLTINSIGAIHASDNPIPVCFLTWYNGIITDEQPIQEFIVDATGAEYMTVTMKATSGDLDPFIEVHDEETGDRVANATNIWLGSDRIAKVFNLPVGAKNYIISASRIRKETGTTTGGFSLYLDIGGPEEMFTLEGNVTGGGNMFDGDIVEGYLRDINIGNNAGEGDRWYFEGNTGDIVTINLNTSHSLRSYSNAVSLELTTLDRYVSQDESISETMVSGGDNASTQLSLLNQRLPVDGRYVVLVSLRNSSSFGGDIADDEQFAYTLEMLGSGESRPTITCSVPIAAVDLSNPPYEQLGLSVDTNVLNNVRSMQDEVSDSDLIQSYAFAANAGDLVTVTMTRTSGDLIPLIGVQDINGDLLDRETADLSGRRAVMNFLVPDNGWYVILATREDVDDGTTSGAYLLDFEGSSIASDPSAVPPPDIGLVATVVERGQVIETTISDENHIEYYLISAQSDDTISIEMRRTTGDLDPFVAVLDTDLSVLVRGNPNLAGNISSLIFTAPSNGWYVIAATRDGAEGGSSIGDFSLKLD